MGFIRDKWETIVKKATETATQTVKEITKEDTKSVVDVLGNVAKIGIFIALTASAVKGASTVHNVVKTVPASEVLEPVVRTAAATPVVQIFLGDGKGVHIQ